MEYLVIFLIIGVAIIYAAGKFTVDPTRTILVIVGAAIAIIAAFKLLFMLI